MKCPSCKETEKLVNKLRTYCVDIDGTLCLTHGSNYPESLPYTDRIEKINRIRVQGAYVKIFTARGTSSGIDWSEFTVNQLSDWGVSYDEIIFGKPHADIFVDDKGTEAGLFFDQLDSE